MGEDSLKPGRVFLSYVKEDSSAVDWLQDLLEAAGIKVWRDTADLWPGADWRYEIRRAISRDALIFVACFSSYGIAKRTDRQNEELSLAIDEIRKLPAHETWLIPVRLDDCEIPDRPIDGTRTLTSLQPVDLFGPGAEQGARRLVDIVRRTSGSHSSQAECTEPGRRPAAAEPAFGIITALSEEFAAVRALIDDPERRNKAGDRADYVVGSMPSLDPARPHPVVLTMLGGTGNDAASCGCANLLRSFWSVRCVLMAGIAAGVPNVRRPDRHVRLGDIVTSRWGIAEYDSVTNTAQGPRKRRDFPPASPLLERRAKMLDAGEMIGLRPWEEWITLGARNLAAFGRPPESTDVLFASDDTDELVPHPDPAISGHRPGWPKVHCGVIASGDRSLRSARWRDQIVACDPDVHAIEMEGKGVGNTGFSEGVEYLVVRGVSDYGDAHVTPAWRKYAALAAAAYARALLAECPPFAGAHLSDLVTTGRAGP